MNNDELMHYGKVGMKWGKRKASSASSSKNHSNKTTSTSKPDSKSRLSDVELKSRINRIEMEQKYSKLTAAKVSPGKKMAMDILSTAFKSTAQAYVTKMMGNALNNMTTAKASSSAGSSSNPSSTPKPNVNASTAEPHKSSYSRESKYVYPDFKLLN